MREHDHDHDHDHDPGAEQVPESGDDFLAEDFAEDFAAGSPGIPVAPDFVETTWQLVVADQAEIRADAGRVEDIRIPHELLDAYSVPAVSADFVERTAARVTRDLRSERSAWQRVIRSLVVPSVSPDFVGRILDALRLDRAAPRVLPMAEQRRRAFRRAESPRVRGSRWLVAAAAVLAIGLGLFYGGAFQDRAGPPREASVALARSSQSLTPVRWSTALSRRDEAAVDDLRFEPVDSLMLLANFGAERAKNRSGD